MNEKLICFTRWNQTTDTVFPISLQPHPRSLAYSCFPYLLSVFCYFFFHQVELNGVLSAILSGSLTIDVASWEKNLSIDLVCGYAEDAEYQWSRIDNSAAVVGKNASGEIIKQSYSRNSTLQFEFSEGQPVWQSFFSQVICGTTVATRYTESN